MSLYPFIIIIDVYSNNLSTRTQISIPLVKIKIDKKHVDYWEPLNTLIIFSFYYCYCVFAFVFAAVSNICSTVAP